MSIIGALICNGVILDDSGNGARVRVLYKRNVVPGSLAFGKIIESSVIVQIFNVCRLLIRRWIGRGIIVAPKRRRGGTAIPNRPVVKSGPTRCKLLLC